MTPLELAGAAWLGASLLLVLLFELIRRGLDRHGWRSDEPEIEREITRVSERLMRFVEIHDERDWPR